MLSTNADGPTSTTYPHNPTQEADVQIVLGAAEMVRGQRQGRVTDRGKEQSGAYPSAMFAGGHKLASNGAHLSHEAGDGVQSQVRRGGGPRALSTSAIAYRKHAHACLRETSCWFI
jgi:hypothetical protein